MEGFRNNSSCLELSIAMPGFSFSPSSLPSGEINHGSSTMKELLDMNQVPSSGTEDECMEEEDESSNGGPAPRKKLRLTKEQSRLLEETFRLNHTLNPKEKEGLALQLKLKPRQVEVWFQNRRARSKLKQTEMEFEYLKRWFGSLTEQNRVLQKEVEELRAMKVGHHGGRHPTPPSTLTMCPRCERVTTATLGHNDGSTATNTRLPLLLPRPQSAACQH